MMSAETMVFSMHRNGFLRLQKTIKGLALFLLVLFLGCAPKEESADSSPTVYSLSVTVSGLNGTLILSSGTGSGSGRGQSAPKPLHFSPPAFGTNALFHV